MQIVLTMVHDDGQGKYMERNGVDEHDNHYCHYGGHQEYCIIIATVSYSYPRHNAA